MKLITYALALLTVASLGAPIRAQDGVDEGSASDPAEMTDAERLAEATRLSDIGRLFFDGEEYADAAEAFGRAFDLHNNDVLGYNAARSYEYSGNPELALDYYNRTQDVTDEGSDLADRCDEGITRMQNMIAASQEARQRQPATVEVATVPPGAEVFIDAEAVGYSPITLQLAAGEHLIRVIGDFEYQDTLTLEAGQNLSLVLDLLPPGDRDPDPGPVADDGGPNWWAVGLTAGGSVLLIVSGAAVAEVALDRFDEAQQVEVLRNNALFEATVEEGRQAQGGSKLLYTLGILGLGASVALYFLTDTSDDTGVESRSGIPFGIGMSDEGAAAFFNTDF